jgi:hypothetical protein
MSIMSMTGGSPWNWLNPLLTAQNWTQPILPNWSFGPAFTINNNNSTAPQTELEVFQHHSYGRQLGRIADVLEVLVNDRGAEAGKTEPFKSFLDMKKDVDKVKANAAVSRAKQLRSDLAFLKASRSPEYDRLRAALLRVLEE